MTEDRQAKIRWLYETHADPAEVANCVPELLSALREAEQHVAAADRMLADQVAEQDRLDRRLVEAEQARDFAQAQSTAFFADGSTIRGRLIEAEQQRDEARRDELQWRRMHADEYVALQEARDREARLREALEAWMEFNAETREENPCPDLLRRSMLRKRAAELTRAALSGTAAPQEQSR